MGAREDVLTRWVERLENYPKGADPRAAEIEKLVSKCEKAGDHVKAEWIRRYTNTDYIRSIAKTCRAFIKHGEIDKADVIRKHFERHRLHIQDELDQQHIARGRKVVNAARAGHQEVHGDDAQKRDKWRRMQAELDAEKAKGTKKAAQTVADRHGVDVRTVYRLKEYLSKID